MTALAWQRKLNHVFESAGADIVLEQWVILVNLQHHNDIVQGNLADMLMRDKSFMTRIVDDLEDRGLVKRQRDPEDRRRWRIHLTARGSRFVDKLVGLVVQTSREAEQELGEKELQTTRHVLRHMFANLTGHSIDRCWAKLKSKEAASD